MPLSIDLALAYSCNCFVAHMAERFERGELAREFQFSFFRIQNFIVREKRDFLTRTKLPAAFVLR